MNLTQLPTCLALKLDNSIPIFALAPLSVPNKYLLIFSYQGFCTVATGKTAMQIPAVVLVLLKRMAEVEPDFYSLCLRGSPLAFSLRMQCGFSVLQRIRP